MGQELILSLTVAGSMMGVIVMAALIGTFVPIVLYKRGIDPAIATGPFITTANDIFGIFPFLLHRTTSTWILNATGHENSSSRRKSSAAYRTTRNSRISKHKSLYHAQGGSRKHASNFDGIVVRSRFPIDDAFSAAVGLNSLHGLVLE